MAIEMCSGAIVLTSEDGALGVGTSRACLANVVAIEKCAELHLSAADYGKASWVVLP
jgi:hypothetical protein